MRSAIEKILGMLFLGAGALLLTAMIGGASAALVGALIGSESVKVLGGSIAGFSALGFCVLFFTQLGEVIMGALQLLQKPRSPRT